MDYKNCSYKLITEKYISKATLKNCAKVYYIIYLQHRSTHVESNKIGFPILWFYCDLLWFFKNSIKIDIKEKVEKLLPSQLQTTKGGNVPGFRSSRSLFGQFCCSGRKNKICPKLRGVKKTFSFSKSPCQVLTGPDRRPKCVW